MTIYMVNADHQHDDGCDMERKFWFEKCDFGDFFDVFGAKLRRGLVPCDLIPKLRRQTIIDG